MPLQNRGICRGEYPAVYEYACTGAKHNPELVKIAQEVAASHNCPMAIRQREVPDADDATPFSLSGISATCLEAGRATEPIYHAHRDTYDHIKPESLSMKLQLVIDLIQRIDKGKLAGSA